MGKHHSIIGTLKKNGGNIFREMNENEKWKMKHNLPNLCTYVGRLRQG